MSLTQIPGRVLLLDDRDDWHEIHQGLMRHAFMLVAIRCGYVRRTVTKQSWTR